MQKAIDHVLFPVPAADEGQELAQILTLLTEVTMALGQNQDLADVLDHCLQAIAHYLNVSFVRVWTFSHETNLLELQAIAGQHSYTEDFYSRIPLGISIIGHIAQTRQPYVTNTVAQDLILGGKEWVQREGFVAFAGYPLILDDRLIGVLALFNRQPFTQTMQSLLASLARTLAIAVDRLWARVELLSDREALLFQLASQMRNTLDLDTILGTAVTEIRRLLHIDRCHFLWCWSQATHPILAITHEAKVEELPSLLGECPEEQAISLGATILNLSPIRTNDVTTDMDLDSSVRQALLNLDITSQLLVPLETRSGQLGAIVCSHCSSRSWSDSEVELLQAVVDQLALAIDQAELYAQTRAAAAAAQTQANQLSEAIQNLKQTQTQLIQSEKMSSLGQMVAGIAHEINNPVNFITGNLSHASNYIQDILDILELYQQFYPEPAPEIQELAESLDLDFIATDLPKLLSSMRIGADRIRQIVLSLRNFSRLDEAEMKPVDVHEGIDSTLLILQSRLKPTSGKPGIQLNKEYGELPAIDCYPGQLNQVFMNVLANAIDALEEQPDPIITIHTELLQDQGTLGGLPGQPAVLISIQDNGPGMPEAVRTHLFDPFFTTKPIGKGTGLGLSISYQIVVEKHQGQFECRSEPGQGAEFRIVIPIAPPKATKAGRQEQGLYQ